MAEEQENMAEEQENMAEVEEGNRRTWQEGQDEANDQELRAILAAFAEATSTAVPIQIDDSPDKPPEDIPRRRAPFSLQQRRQLQRLEAQEAADEPDLSRDELAPRHPRGPQPPPFPPSPPLRQGIPQLIRAGLMERMEQEADDDAASRADSGAPI